MGYPKKLLSEDENVVLETHPHWKMLVAAGARAARDPRRSPASCWPWSTTTSAATSSAAVAAVMLLVFFVVPFLRWRTTLFVITDKRVVVRTGILSRTGRDIPLSRVNDVTFQHNLLERILGCGTLVVESAGERGQVELNDIPHVEKVQHTLYELVENAGPLWARPSARPR